MRPPSLQQAAILAGVAALYFIAGKIGLSLASIHTSATAVWPPTGIALAANLILGNRVWPGVFLGAFLVNITTAGNLASSLGIAAGNTAENILGAYLVRRFARGWRFYEQPRDLFKFAGLAGALSPVVGATVGVASLVLQGLAAWPSAGAIWLTWWLGDGGGALIVAPLLVLWNADVSGSWSLRRTLEAVLLLLSILGSGFLVFGGIPPFGDRNYPLTFLALPPLLWAAYRFEQRAASTAVVLLSGIAIGGTLRGHGPFGSYAQNESLLLLQAFTAVISVTILSLAAAVSQRRLADSAVRKLSSELEGRVVERTAELSRANRELRSEIRERSRAQEELVRSEARLREAQKLARIGSWEWDVERNVISWSEALYELYGVDPSRFGQTFESFLERVHPEDRDRTRTIVDGALRDRQPFVFEHRIVRPDGAVLTLLARGRVLTDELGNPVRMVGTGEDITERRRAEEERARLIEERAARREAEEANRLKDEFLATVSHELRTPLNAIVGWTHLLQSGNLDPEAATRAIDTVSRNAQIQTHLISDILDISRMAMGQLELKRQPVDLHDLIGRSIETMRPAAVAKGIRIEADLERPERSVLGDPERLEQVVWNLLSNAIKFSLEGGRVTILLDSQSTTARIRVEDEGPGIAPEFLPYVFDRFRQRDSSHTRRHGGLGLGLAIVKHLVQSHDGTVTAANRPQGGAVFTVALPLAGAVEPEAASADAPSSDASGTPLRGLRVLLVEDEPDSRELLGTLLSRCGAEVETVASAEEALAKLSATVPDLLVSDIEMPGRNGYDLVRSIRRLTGRRGTIPAVALTAHAGADAAAEALRAGYQAHVVKPVRVEDLVRAARLAVDGAPGGGEERP